MANNTDDTSNSSKCKTLLKESNTATESSSRKPKNLDISALLMICNEVLNQSNVSGNGHHRNTSESDSDKESNKPITVVIKGIPVEITEEDIMKELKAKKFSPIAIYRVPCKERVLVQVPSIQNNRIFSLEECCGAKIRIVRFSKKYDVEQCKRCKQFGHSVNRCSQKFDEGYDSSESIDALNVIMSGLPPEITEDRILVDLKYKQFDVDKIYRLANDKIGFKLPKHQDHIFYLSCCLGFSVITEDAASLTPIQVSPSNYLSGKQNPIRVVIRGIPKDIKDEFVERDLKSKGFSLNFVHRMKIGERNVAMVTVELPETQLDIYCLKCCLGFEVTVEKFAEGSYHLPQCKVCNKIGHKNCLASGRQPSADLTCINVVINGIPLEYDENTVCEDLKAKSFTPVASHRMVDEEGCDLPMLLVHLPKSQKSSIMHLSCCLGFDVIVEDLRPSYQISQCRDCKQFGHTIEKCPEKTKELTTDEIKCETAENNVSGAWNEFLQMKENWMDLLSKTLTKSAPFLISESKEVAEQIREAKETFPQMLSAMARIVKHLTEAMSSISDIPGITSHMLNESIHVLQEIEEAREKFALESHPLWCDYHSHFPKLN